MQINKENILKSIESFIEADNELWGKLNIMDRDLIQKIIVVPSKDGGKRPSIVNFVLKEQI
jgi:hypothetical protein